MAYPLTDTARSSAGVTIDTQAVLESQATRVWSPLPPSTRLGIVVSWPKANAWPESGQGWPRIQQR